MSYVQCVVIEIDGARHWRALEFIGDNKRSHHFAGYGTQEGIYAETIYIIHADGHITDNRMTPPFRGIVSQGTQIIPCPGCNVLEDKNHDPAKHTNAWYPGLVGLPSVEVHADGSQTAWVK